MTDRDLASDLEFWSGRARNDGAAAPDRPPKPYRRSKFRRQRLRLPTLRLPALRLPDVERLRSRVRSFEMPSFGRRGNPAEQPRTGAHRRPVAAAVLLAGLTIAWLAVGHQSHGAASADAPQPVAPVTAAPTTARPPAPPPRAIDRAVVDTAECVGLALTQPHVRCGMDGFPGHEEIALYTSATVGPEFRRVAGEKVQPRTGPPACASGRPDERAWSLPTAPYNAVGRYLCRFETGRAAIWWTHGDRLLHVVSDNANLAALYSWWAQHPSE